MEEVQKEGEVTGERGAPTVTVGVNTNPSSAASWHGDGSVHQETNADAATVQWESGHGVSMDAPGMAWGVEIETKQPSPSRPSVPTGARRARMAAHTPGGQRSRP